MLETKNQPSTQEQPNRYTETMILVARMLFPALLAKSHTNKKSEMLSAFVYDALSAVAVAFLTSNLTEFDNKVQIGGFIALSFFRMAMGEHLMADAQQAEKQAASQED